MYYIANTVYHAELGNLQYARSSAIWPDATLDQLQDVEALYARLPGLVERFKQAMRSVGFEID